MVTDHFAAALSNLDQEMINHVPPGGNWRDIPPSIPSRRLEQIRANSKAGRGSRSTYYGRLQWDRPAYTISTYFNRPGNGCYIHPTEDRLVSIREAARLQSFPDSFRFFGSPRKRSIQIGNAVPPLLAYHIARVLPQGRYVDAFCGAGGMSLGFEWSGSECIAATDIDEACLEAFSKNRQLPESTVVSTDLSNEDSYHRFVRHAKSLLAGSSLDFLIGGPPCQGFSTAGNNRLEDPRNLLVWAFVQLIQDLAPGVVVMENVPALAWKRSSGILNALLNRISSLGYAATTIIAHAETFGVPQTRRRLFVLAARDPSRLKIPAPMFRVIEPSYRRHQPGIRKCGESPPTVRDAIADLPGATVENPDQTTGYAGPAQSLLSRWLRGEQPLESIASQGNVGITELRTPMGLFAHGEGFQ